MRKLRLLLALALAASVAALSQATATTAAWQAELDPQLAAAMATAAEPLEVVVTFQGDAAPTSADVQALRDVGITIGFTFRELPIAGVLATPAQIEALRARSEVVSLWANRQLTYDLDESTALIGVDALRADAKLTRRNGGVPVSGAGAGILINDSGIDGTHRDVEYPSHVVQNVAAAANLRAWSDLLPVTYVENVPNTDSTGGHGTHVAGIAGGNGAYSTGKYEGVAPGAKLVGYGSGAGLLILDVIGGFDYAIAKRNVYDIRAINNSWGDTGDMCTPVNPNDPVTRATYLTYKAGIVVVFSAGNSGRSGECTITGNYKKAPWVVAVAAGAKNGSLADFSSRGSPGGGGTVTVDGQTWRWEDRPTLTAPGVFIAAARAPSPIGLTGTDDDVTMLEPQYWPYYTHLSGTSMAAPHIAGVAALMLDANPALTPLQVKDILQRTATRMPYATWEAGAGYVDAHAAVRRSFGG
jgi:serine protease AprX